MVVGVLTIAVRLHGNRSLKGKRRVISGLKTKLRNTFNVAVSEVANQDVHDSGIVAVVTVANDRKKVESRLNKVQLKAEAVCDEEIVGSEVEFFCADPGQFDAFDDHLPEEFRRQMGALD